VPHHQQCITAISVVLFTQANISKPMLYVQSDGPGVVSFDFKHCFQTIFITPAGLQDSLGLE
jgi:hypothetical protein